MKDKKLRRLFNKKIEDLKIATEFTPEEVMILGVLVDRELKANLHYRKLEGTWGPIADEDLTPLKAKMVKLEQQVREKFWEVVSAEVSKPITLSQDGTHPSLITDSDAHLGAVGEV